MDRDSARPSTDSSPESMVEVARAVALRRLAMGPRTRAQLREAMLAKDVPGPVAEEVLDRFARARLIDDAEFAREWVRIRHRDKGLSQRALAQELRRKGVDDDDSAPALAAVGHDQERAAAEALVAKKLPSTRGLEYPRRVSRLMGLLARKGYGPGLASEVVRAAVAADGEAGTGL